MIKINLFSFGVFLISCLLGLVDSLEKETSFDFGFYYNSYSQEILFYNYKDELNAELTLDPQMHSLYPIYLTEFIQVISESKVLLQENLIDFYSSQAELGEFIVSNHSLLLDGVQIYLVRIEYNVSSVQYNEVIMEIPSMGIVSSYPQSVEGLYRFAKCTQCAKDAIERTNKEISNTFAFQVTDELLTKGEIEKIYLIAKQNDRLTYYADLSASYQIQSKDENVTSIDFYLERLPEVFDLHITYHSNNDINFEGDKLLLVIKDIRYPNYEVTRNPNFKMLIISISLVLIGFLLTSIALILKLFIFKSK